MDFLKGDLDFPLGLTPGGLKARITKRPGLLEPGTRSWWLNWLGVAEIIYPPKEIGISYIYPTRKEIPGLLVIAGGLVTTGFTPFFFSFIWFGPFPKRLGPFFLTGTGEEGVLFSPPFFLSPFLNPG